MLGRFVVSAGAIAKHHTGKNFAWRQIYISEYWVRCLGISSAQGQNFTPFKNVPNCNPRQLKNSNAPRIICIYEFLVRCLSTSPQQDRNFSHSNRPKQQEQWMTEVRWYARTYNNRQMTSCNSFTCTYTLRWKPLIPPTVSLSRRTRLWWKVLWWCAKHLFWWLEFCTARVLFVMVSRVYWMYGIIWLYSAVFVADFIVFFVFCCCKWQCAGVVVWYSFPNISQYLCCICVVISYRLSRFYVICGS